MFKKSNCYSNKTSANRRSKAADKHSICRKVCFCALAALILLSLLTSCHIISIDIFGGPTDIAGASFTPRPSDQAEHTGNIDSRTPGPEDTASADITRGPEPPVSPIPDTPYDPMSPDNYPMPDDFKARLTSVLNRARGDNIYSKIYSIMNNGSASTPFFFYDYDDMITEFPGYLELAQYMLQKGHGVCYHYASLTCYLLRAAGHEAYVIHGYRTEDYALHYWTIVKTDQGWYHFDPLHHQMLMTDAEKSSDDATSGNGITWQAGVWPETPKNDYVE